MHTCSRTLASQGSESTPLLSGDRRYGSRLADSPSHHEGKANEQQTRQARDGPSSSIPDGERFPRQGQRDAAHGSLGGSPGSPSPPEEQIVYTVADLAAITGWAKTHFTNSAPASATLERRNRGQQTTPIDTTGKHHVSERASDASVQHLLEKLARGIAFDDWSSRSAGADPEDSRDASSDPSSATSPSSPEKILQGP